MLFLRNIIYSISIFLLFSNSLHANTDTGKIYQLFQFESTNLTQHLELSKLPDRHFQDTHIQTQYLHIQDYTLQLHDILVRAYAQGTFSYYEMSDIIKQYQGFIYSVDIVFGYHMIEQDIGQSPEIQQALTRSYERMYRQYTQLQHTIRHYTL